MKTNAEFAKEDNLFKESCEKVGLPFKSHEKFGLKRQASKWRNKKGLAWKSRSSST